MTPCGSTGKFQTFQLTQETVIFDATFQFLHLFQTKSIKKNVFQNVCPVNLLTT